MPRSNIESIIEACRAWLAGEWQVLPITEKAAAEEAQLVEVLSQIRRRLMTASDLKVAWDSHTDELKDRLRNAEVLNQFYRLNV